MYWWAGSQFVCISLRWYIHLIQDSFLPFLLWNIEENIFGVVVMDIFFFETWSVVRNAGWNVCLQRRNLTQYFLTSSQLCRHNWREIWQIDKYKIYKISSICPNPSTVLRASLTLTVCFPVCIVLMHARSQMMTQRENKQVFSSHLFSLFVFAQSCPSTRHTHAHTSCLPCCFITNRPWRPRDLFFFNEHSKH